MTDLNEKIVIRSGGMDYKIDWCANVAEFTNSAVTILLPRMPLTFAERVWLWQTLPTALRPGASIRLVGPSLHG